MNQCTLLNLGKEKSSWAVWTVRIRPTRSYSHLLVPPWWPEICPQGHVILMSPIFLPFLIFLKKDGCANLELLKMFYVHQKSTTFVKDSSLAWAPFLNGLSSAKCTVMLGDKREIATTSFLDTLPETIETKGEFGFFFLLEHFFYKIYIFYTICLALCHFVGF